MNLRNYTHFSVYESIIRIPELVRLAKETGQSHLGIADRCNMYGADEFYRACKSNEINPVIGQEFYVCDGPDDKRKPRELDRIIVYAKNYNGYKTLMRMSTEGMTSNFYYVPRISFESLSKYTEDVFVVMANQVQLWLETRSFNPSGLMDNLAKYAEIYGEDMYLCIEPNRSSARINEWIEDNWRHDKVIVSNPNRYLFHDEHDLHDVIYTIQANFTKRKKKNLPSDDYYFMTEDEILDKLSNLSNAKLYLENTKKLAECVNIVIPEDYKFPKFEGMDEDEAFKYMKDTAEFDLRLKAPSDQFEKYKERFDMECGVVRELGFSNYFLVVADIVNGAKKLGVEVGPGRGSVCGSVLAWALGIHEIDPIENGLYFERFLNPERVSMPDIDLDFEDENRHKVIDYISEKYGENRVAHICTYSTLGIKAAMKDVARATGVDFEQSNVYTSVIPDKPGTTIEQVMDDSGFQSFYEQDSVFRKVFDTAVKIEGLFRQISSHAAAFVIAPDDILNYTPLQNAKDGSRITQFNMHAIEKMGLVKMDILGLRNMSIVRNTIELTGDRTVRERMKRFDDVSTYEMLNRGDTIGVFQIDGGGMTEIGIQMQLRTRADLADLVALYRPAVMQGGLHYTYISNRKGETNDILHPLLADTFSDTYGVPLYQESLMKLAGEFSGFTYGRADILRKAIGKKNVNLLNSMRKEFVDGAVEKREVKTEDAEDVWTKAFEGAADYGFNKSHALAYGSIAYYTAFLKCNYPVEFYASLLSSIQEEQKKERYVKYVNDAIKHKIKIYTPDINLSEERCIPNSGGIVLSLASIRGIGDSYARSIVEERKKNGNFKDIHDFCRRMKPNITQLTYLINARAFYDYEKYVNCVEELIEYNKRIQKDLEKHKGGLDIFMNIEEFKFPEHKTPSTQELAELLFEATGLRFEDGFDIGQIYTVSTVLKEVRYYTTKKGQPMAYAKMKAYPSYELIIFPRQFGQFKDLIKNGAKLKIDFTLIKESKLSLEMAESVD